MNINQTGLEKLIGGDGIPADYIPRGKLMLNAFSRVGSEMSKTSVMVDVSRRLVAITEPNSVARIAAVAKLAHHCGVQVIQPKDGDLSQIGFMSLEAGGDEFVQSLISMIDDEDPFPDLKNTV